ncbi:hypothetical protein [Actinopolyspora mortivallis]|uniref:Uncharacterized protein n=1 Tax=Actinopolyspora mortivallis TaxID=33906 RepID=A0A2T0GSQ6_ACTMO|nr:hypothetical protein [Actinopolyspora mortivallis]PRW62130.1 hypothetical protein CEP50_17215 [Actinopolyspora mortivallis]
MTSTDYLRGYTAPRALLVGTLFLLAVACRLPAVVLAIAVHVLDRLSDQLLTATAAIPAVPTRVMPRSARSEHARR